MSQAMLMRIIALENKVEELRDYVVALVEAISGQPQTDELPYRIEGIGTSWWRVFGPDGEITEKGMRKHEAQALADDLNQRALSETSNGTAA